MGQSAELNGFVPWTQVAPRGSSTVYHRGDLANDAHDCDDQRPAARFAQKAAAAVRRAAWEAYQAGLVILVQRRNAAGSFDYLAVKL